jgi:hypothetical protein
LNMKMYKQILMPVLLLLASCAANSAREQPLLQSDFESDPRASGWLSGTYKGIEAQTEWVESATAHDEKHLSAKRGFWRSPEVPVTPSQYYEIRFRYKCASGGFWTVSATDSAGNQLPDIDSSLDNATEWTEARLCFRAMAGAELARVSLRATRTAPLCVDDFVLRPIDRRLAAQWADSLYKSMPPVLLPPPSGRPGLLPRAFRKLRNRETVTIVLLGDSIMNDTGNSALDVLLERQFRGASVRLANSVRGSTGCSYYAREGRVKQYVLDYQPDLLIIGGISHGYETDPIREVIRQVRAQSQCDILILTGAVASLESRIDTYLQNSRTTREGALNVIEAFPGRLANMAREEHVAFFDIGAAWDSYVKESAQPPSWFRRDSVHANDRGKQVLARLLLSYLSTR